MNALSTLAISLRDEITAEVDGIFRGKWTHRDGLVVPEPETIALESNEGVRFEEAAVLYADLAGSTNMVDTYRPEFAAAVYKAYLAGAARVIRSQGGTITAYDGDRVMAAFIGDRKNSDAVTCALKINYVVEHIVNPVMRSRWNAPGFAVRHVVGIDSSPMLVTRTGIRGGNDLVWVGRAANHAAKLASIKEIGYSTYISEAVFRRLAPDARNTLVGSQPMWEQRTWNAMGGATVYRSGYWWAV